MVEDKLNHVRNNVNPALWAETFQDEVELFAADEAGQAAKTRLALLELAAKPGPENSEWTSKLKP